MPKFRIAYLFCMCLLMGCAGIGLLGETLAVEGAVAEVAMVGGRAAISAEITAASRLGASEFLMGRRLVTTSTDLSSFSVRMTSGLDLLSIEPYISKAEFDILTTGRITSESSLNSMVSRVRINIPKTGNPEFYIQPKSNLRLKIGEFLSNENKIRLTRNGAEYPLPGRLSIVNKQNVILRSGLKDYKVLAHINPNQVVFVLEEFPLEKMVKVRVGPSVGFLEIASLIILSDFKSSQFPDYIYQSHTCTVCNGGRTFFCNDCSGSGSVICDGCSGNMTQQCIYCNGSTRKQCEDCKGNGRIGCRVCSETGKIGEQFCSSCNGKGSKFCETCKGQATLYCDKCAGKGVTNCIKCRGFGKSGCLKCNRKGKYDCSSCNGSGLVWSVSR